MLTFYLSSPHLSPFLRRPFIKTKRKSPRKKGTEKEILPERSTTKHLQMDAAQMSMPIIIYLKAFPIVGVTQRGSKIGLTLKTHFFKKKIMLLFKF